MLETAPESMARSIEMGSQNLGMVLGSGLYRSRTSCSDKCQSYGVLCLPLCLYSGLRTEELYAAAAAAAAARVSGTTSVMVLLTLDEKFCQCYDMISFCSEQDSFSHIVRRLLEHDVSHTCKCSHDGTEVS